ncbi:MAG TPA: glycoside hydrolase family 88 protein [Catenuloplanes sp.]
MTFIDTRVAAATTLWERALPAALSTVRRNIDAFAGFYPDDTTRDGVYQPRAARNGFAEGGNHGWTTGFWPGMLWLSYQISGDPAYRHAGEIHARDFARRLAEGIDLDTHDLGFLYTLSCGTPHRLLGDEEAGRSALAAAHRLMTRFLEPAGIIQAWGDLSDPAQRGRTIIDSLMNMPLLYRAAQVTGDDSFARAARRHTAQLREHIIRPDNSTFHTFYWDATSGVPLRGATEQGDGDHSCWARGQAWGIYGFSLNYRHTADDSFLHAAVRCADYFLAHLPADGVPFWDLVFADGSGEERDSSAAAIAVCGLQELVTWLPAGAQAQRYRDAADTMLASLVRGYATLDRSQSNALLLHGVYDKPKSVGVDEGNLWGDYFYLEALVRATNPLWQSYW